MEHEGCVLIKKKELEELYKELNELREAKKPDSIILDYSRRHRNGFEYWRVTTDINLSDGLRSQILRLADMVANHALKKVNEREKSIKEKALEEALIISKNNFAWNIPKRIQQEIDKLK